MYPEEWVNTKYLQRVSKVKQDFHEITFYDLNETEKKCWQQTDFTIKRR